MKQKKETKPKINLYYIIWIVIGALLGFFLGEFYTVLGYPLQSFTILEGILTFVILVTTIYFQIFLHEFGHLVFGLLSGYHFLSFRIFDFMFVKINHRIVLRKYHLNGTAGQCLMIPPEPRNGIIPATLYNMGGVIMNLLSSFIGVIFLYKYFSYTYLSLWQFSFIIIGIVMALTNGIPMVSSTVVNDGTNAIALQNNPLANRAFYLQMKMNVLQTNGLGYKDMPDEWFQLPEDKDMDNVLIASMVVFTCSRFMEEQKFDDFCRTLDHYEKIDCALNAIHLQLMQCDRLYIEMLRGATKEEIDTKMTKAIQKTIKAMKNYPAVMRFQYTYHLFFESDEHTLMKMKKHFNEETKNYPYEAEVKMEKQLIMLAEETKNRNIKAKNKEEKS